MPRYLHRLRIVFLIVLALFLPARGATGPQQLSSSVTSAHTIALENETGFTSLQYTAILELNKWGHFEVVGDRGSADVVLLLSSGSHVREVPEGQFPQAGMNAFAEGAAVPAGYTRVALVDPKTGSVLWSDLRKTDGGKVKNGHLLDGLRQAFDEYNRAKNKR